MPNPRYSHVEALPAPDLDGLLSYRLGTIFHFDGKTFLCYFSLYDILTRFLQSTTFNFSGIIITRIALGVFESGFGPAIPLYFCRPTSLAILVGHLFTDTFVSVFLHQSRNGVKGMAFVASRRLLLNQYRWHTGLVLLRSPAPLEALSRSASNTSILLWQNGDFYLL